MNAKRITVADTLDMSIEDRLQLVHDLWDSIAAFPDSIEISEDHRRIIAERLEAHRRDPSAVFSWEDVKADILGQL